jgi:alpha-L-fucosidase
MTSMRLLRSAGAALVAAAVVCLMVPARAADDPAAAVRLKRFNDLKFGMFIHWGPYSLASVEASWPIMTPPRTGGITEAEYRALPQRFNPVQFDPKAWVRLARAAGQRYMVLTSKHHDGFCMFDSAFTDYKITKTPYGKDIAAMLAQTAREEQMPFGFYYSPPDLNHPGFRDTSRPSSENWRGEPARPEWPLYLSYMELQVRELLTRYGDVFVVWFDGLGQQEKYDGTRFLRTIRDMQPMALVNNRVGLTADFVTPEQRLPKGIPVKGARVGMTNPDDAGLSAEPPSPEAFQPWETCMTINQTWAYNANDRVFKSTTELVRTLVEVASRGGNLLLNVGPTPAGTIQPEFEERLLAIGAWLKVNGEAIYGTTYGPLQQLPFARTTAKNGTTYLHVLDWPAHGPITVPGVRATVRAVRLLAGNRPIEFTQQSDVLTIQAGGITPDPHATVLAIDTR